MTQVTNTLTQKRQVARDLAGGQEEGDRQGQEGCDQGMEGQYRGKAQGVSKCRILCYL